MDSVKLQQIVEQAIQEYVGLTSPYDEVVGELIADREHARYIVLNIGWNKRQRIHSTLLHVDIVNGKAWIQQDNTEDGFATDLVRAGVPHDCIVLAFHLPEKRRFGEFAEA
jgi:hypothetical protein